MAPLLSVIVPTYGVGEYLPACLDSILASTLEDLEVIVVDDGSPDESGEIADDYARVDPRVKPIHKENGGVGAARNTGVAAATGKYIAFADPDDLVPPRAYELLVGSCEATGSDIAAGNAWRYIEGKGNVPSWTHKDVFSENRIKTHIRELPTLIRDRMLWNKVYRRSFWNEHDYVFPHMRYEDYPIALRAHIDAGTVDVLSDKVYMWRQRVSETSITQRSLDLDNIHDRVKSADMVLDTADAAGGEIRRLIHAYMIDIDLVTLATAVAEAEDPSDKAEIERLAVGLARRLSPVDDGPETISKLIHHALRRGDTATAGLLAQWRLTKSNRDLLTGLAHSKSLGILPAAARVLASARPRLPQLRERKLRVRLMEVSRAHHSSSFQVEVNMRRVFLDRATFDASLVGDGRGDIPLESRVVAINGQRATVEIELPDSTVAALPDQPLQLVVTARIAPATWRGAVNSPRDEHPLPFEVAPGQWCVISHAPKAESSTWVRRVTTDYLVDVELGDGVLSVHVDPRHQRVAVVRPAPSKPLIRKVIDGVATFELDQVLADPADDPVSGRAFRDIVALEPAAAAKLQPGGLDAARLVSEVTGAEDEEATGGSGVPVTPGELTTEVATAETGEPEDEADEGTLQARLQRMLERTGITPLVLRDFTEKPLVWGDHIVALHRSRTGTAELSHQLRDHLPRW